MKIAFVADVHLANHRRFGGEMRSGLNRRFNQTLDVLSLAVDTAKAEGATALYVLGDLFDTAKPTPQELAATASVLAWRRNFQVHLMLGNHDQASNAEGDHAFGPLAYVPHVTIYEKPTCADGMLVVPFQVGNASEWLPTAVRKLVAGLTPLETRTSTLLLHMGIADEDTPSFLRGASDSITVDELGAIMCEHDISHAFAGNWHNAQSWCFLDPNTQAPRHISQLGALVPTGFDNPGTDYGQMMILDTVLHCAQSVYLPGGPRFYNEVFEDLDLEEFENRTAAYSTYLRVTARPKHVKAAQAALQAMFYRGKLVAFEVLPDKEAAQATAKNTARVARNAETIEEAVAAYVAKAELQAGADRKVVLELVTGYLSRG